MRAIESGPNPRLLEALKAVRRYDSWEQLEIARFLFDNLCYFDFWAQRGAAENLRLRLLSLDGRTVSKRPCAAPEAAYLARLWAADKLNADWDEATASRHRSNETLLRRFVQRNLPRAEMEEIRAHDWSA